MRIGDVARRAGVRVSLLRYYEDIGLLARPTA
jgi:DNA-binding transcriptional MerR regulator